MVVHISFSLGFCLLLLRLSTGCSKSSSEDARPRLRMCATSTISTLPGGSLQPAPVFAWHGQALRNRVVFSPRGVCLSSEQSFRCGLGQDRCAYQFWLRAAAGEDTHTQFVGASTRSVGTTSVTHTSGQALPNCTGKNDTTPVSLAGAGDVRSGSLRWNGWVCPSDWHCLTNKTIPVPPSCQNPSDAAKSSFGTVNSIWLVH